MYQVSNAYRTALAQNARSYKIRIKCGNKTWDDENIVRGSFSVTNQCSEESTLQIGQVFIGELSVVLRGTDIGRYDWKGLELRPEFGLVLGDNSVEYIPLGYFIVKTAEYQSDGVKVTAYDRMSKFDRACTLTISQAYLFDLATLACSVCGVVFGTTRAEFANFANANELITIYAENDITTWRDVIFWAAQTSATFATMGKDGKLYFRMYNTQTAVDTIDDTERYTGSSFSGYVTRYTGISVVDMVQQYTRYYALQTDDGLTYNLGSNPFLQFDLDADRERCTRAILNKMQGIAYEPFSVTAKCNPAYDLGDVLVFEDGLADSTVKCCITKYTLNFHGAFQMSGSGEDPALATGHSKTDKNLAGLMSRVEYLENLQRSTERNYFDYTNLSVISITGGNTVKVSDIDYKAGYLARVEYRAEIMFSAVTAETEGSTTFTENDITITASYRDIGQWKTNRYPVETYTDGNHLLHLLYVFTAPAYSSDERKFEAFLTIAGGNISIPVVGVMSYVTVSKEVEQEDVTIDRIEVETMPNKTEYFIGETIDFTGLVVVAVYTDGSKVIITNDCSYSPQNYTLVEDEGTIEIEVTYQDADQTEYTTSFDLEGIYNDVVKIEVTQMPDNYAYREGYEIDHTGVVITATYMDGTTADVTSECTFDPDTGDTFDGETEVNVEYTEHGETVSTSFELEYLEVVSIEVTEDPDTMEYYFGDTLDLTGIEITATYSDGSTAVVTEDCTFDPDEGDSITEDTEVTVEYEENGVTVTTTFDVEYVGLSGIYVKKQPTKLEYRVTEENSETADYTGVKIMACREDGYEFDVTSQCTFNPANGATLTTADCASTYRKEVVVTYTCDEGTFTTKFIITLINEDVIYGQYAIMVGGRPQMGVPYSTLQSRLMEIVDDVNSIKTFERTNVPPPRANSLTVKKMPTKRKYKVGDAIDLTGIVVYANMDARDSVDVTSNCVYRERTNTADAQGHIISSVRDNEVIIIYNFNPIASESVSTTIKLNVKE